MSGTKWTVRRPERAMPQVWDEHARKCVTDRVFDGHEDLLSAAPELLEALQMLRDLQNGPPLITQQAQWHAAMEKAEAAIAKAEGRAS